MWRGIRRYELGDRIGAGGMAEVFRATALDADGSSRKVVLKRILPQFSEDPAYRVMFRDEWRIAAKLRHPNVVELLDAGTLDGQLFLAFEFVDGADVGRVLWKARKQEAPLPLEITLYVISELLKALHYVHTFQDDAGRPLQIVHRDVSPGNVLLSRGGDVKLGDFGVAKAVSRAGKTVPGVIKGNTRYMAPEQLSGGGVDARTDVYAAGMLLHTLVAGRHPLGEAPLGHVLPRILEGKIPSLAETAPDAPKKVVELVRKATMPFATDRHQSAQEMQLAILEVANSQRIFFDSQELATFLMNLFPQEDEEEPLAKPPLPSMRHFKPLIAEVEGNPIPSEVPEESVFRTRAQQPADERDTAEAEPPRPPRRSERPTVLRDDPHRAEPRKPKKSASTVIVQKEDLNRPRKTKIRTKSGSAKMLGPGSSAPSIPPPKVNPPGTTPISQSEEVSRTKPAAPAPEPRIARPPPAPIVPSTPAPVSGEIVAKSPMRPDVKVPVSQSDVSWLEGHKQAVAAIAIGSSGRLAVSAGHEGNVIVWNLRTRQVLRTLQGHTAGVTTVDVDAEGTLAVSGGRDKVLHVWDLESGLPTAKLAGHKGWIFAARLAPDGEHILSGGIDTTIRLWHRDEPKPLRTLKGHEDAVNAISFFPDGTRALSGSRDRTLRVWDLVTNRPERVLDGDLESVRAVAVSPKGGVALVAGASPALRLWDVEAGTEIHRFEGHREGLASVAFSRDGRLAASSSYDGTIRLWDVEKGMALGTLTGHGDAVLAVAFSPDGTFVLSGGADGKLGFWPRRAEKKVSGKP